MQKVGVVRITPATGKRPVSRPGIFLSLRAPDEQNGFQRMVCKDDRYRGFGFCHVHILARSICHGDSLRNSVTASHGAALDFHLIQARLLGHFEFGKSEIRCGVSYIVRRYKYDFSTIGNSP